MGWRWAKNVNSKAVKPAAQANPFWAFLHFGHSSLTIPAKAITAEKYARAGQLASTFDLRLVTAKNSRIGADVQKSKRRFFFCCRNPSIPLFAIAQITARNISGDTNPACPAQYSPKYFSPAIFFISSPWEIWKRKETQSCWAFQKITGENTNSQSSSAR